MPANTLYPRNGTDTSNYWSGVCPVCSKVHKLYSRGPYVCYGLGSPGTVVDEITVSTQDVKDGDAAAQTLINESAVIES